MDEITIREELKQWQKDYVNFAGNRTPLERRAFRISKEIINLLDSPKQEELKTKSYNQK